MSGDNLKELLILYRQIEWQYKLDKYTTESLKTIQKSLDKGRNELFNDLGRREFRLPEGREHMLLQELNDLTMAIQYQLTGDIKQAAMVAGEASLREYSDIISFNGTIDKAISFNPVALSPDQLRAMVDTQVGGKLLESWVADSFESHIITDIAADLMTGNLLGMSTPRIIDRLMQSFDLIKADAETIARTHLAAVNNQAAQAVYKANSDIISKVRWDSTLEVSTKSGSGTCMACAANHGKEYPINEPHPVPPKHHRCRCFMTPVTLSFRELGLDIDDMQKSLKPFTERDGNRKILDAGTIGGSFDDFLKSRGAKYQKNFLGENRYRMWKAGEIKVEDLIDKNGQLRLLQKNKAGEYVGLMP